ncbi:sialate O-acetylesterase [Sphingobacterium thalpophilum]|uniref:Sialate O-acetylesterase n=1 Tax=Sphingobacterium thalpophilum TaxID=259 RepID=A0ABV4HD95_9SPHI
MKTYLLAIFLIIGQLGAHAKVRLSALFTDGMVLQQQSRVPLWGWADPQATVTVQTSWNGRKYQVKADQLGQWKIVVQTPVAGGPYRITIAEQQAIELRDILIGEVWLCSGQSNMEMPLKGYPGQPILGSTEAIMNSKDDLLRIYTVPRNPSLQPVADSKPSVWKKAEPASVVGFSATAYFFGRQLRKTLGVPVGLIHSSYGGSNIEAWMEASWLADQKDIEIPRQESGLKDKNRVPTMLYNGMIHPIAGYGIRGFIWYQGESNYERADQYEILFPRMVEKFRELWGNSALPFYFTQIAPFDYASLPPYHKGGKFNSAYLRDAQRRSLDKIPYSGMAVTLDLGEQNCIHPSHKREGGERLAYLALHDVYGFESIHLKSPVYDKIEIKGSTAILSFRDAPLGLTSYGKEVTTFEIAGKDKVFYPAQAALRGKMIVIASPKVDEPVAVRYAFQDFVIGDVFGANGMPLSSFRTDDW